MNTVTETAGATISGENEAETVLEVSGVSKRFGGLKAVNGVDFRVGRGERVGLLGPNGAGKTTLTNLVSGDLKVSDGQIRLFGKSITDLRPHQRFRLGLARTYQVVIPFKGMTVLESVTLGALVVKSDMPSAIELARQSLERLGLLDRADLRMSSLNIVDIKLVELARVIASSPSILFLDEVLSGLRPSEVGGVLQIVDAVATELNFSVVMIEHLVGAVMSFCDRLLVMDQGTLIADGAADEVANDPNVIDAYLGSKWRRDGA